MPIKPNKDGSSKDKQFIPQTKYGYNHPFSVSIKKSDIFIQPLSASPIHISLHHKREPNCHIRIEHSEVDNFDISGPDSLRIPGGKMIRWTRDVGHDYQCPLSIIYSSEETSSYPEVSIFNDPEFDNKFIQYHGEVHFEFWFTSHDEETIHKSLGKNSGVLIYEFLDETKEYFALTYRLSNHSNRFKNMVNSEDHKSYNLNYKVAKEGRPENPLKFSFGLAQRHKQTIYVH